MLSIYLCDDEPIWLERMQKIILDYRIKSDWVIQITALTNNPEMLLAQVKQNQPVGGIYFLDIDFKSETNGMKAAAEIRKIDPHAYIIFVTTHDELVMETFRLKLAVLDYIVKDTSPLEEQVYFCLQHIEERLLDEKSKNPYAITIRLSDSFYAIPIRDIYYIESVKNTHKICIHLHSSIFYLTNSLTATRARLDDAFIQCHKSYLVNINYIKSLDYVNHQVWMYNNESFYCSFRAWKHLLKKYCVNYLKR